MSDGFMFSQMGILEFRDGDSDRFSVWVYCDGDNPLMVYEDEHPNTVEVWFRFYRFNHFYWKLFEEECIDERRGSLFYNERNMKMFMLRRMLCSTSIPGIDIRYDSRTGCLTEKSMESVMRIHPRIFRVLFDKMDLLPKQMPKSEERELEKQCSILFGKGEGVQNPHEYITTYCNLVAFWDKFGMNYFDILRLPRDVFSSLKKVMSLENTNRSEKLNEMSNSAKSPPSPHHAGRGRQVRF